MGGRRLRWVTGVVLIPLLLAVAAGPAGAGTALSLIAGEERVRVGRGSGDGHVALFGLAPEDCDVYVVSRGPEAKVPLDRYSGGPMRFLTVGTVTVTGAPGYYQILSSAPLEKLPGELQWAMGVTPGYRAIQARVTVWDDERTGGQLRPDEADVCVHNLFRIYEKRGLYGVREGAITRHGPAFYGRLVLPPDVPAGRIEVRAYAVRDGALVAEAATGFTVERTGLLGTLNWDRAGSAPVVAGSAVTVLAAALAAVLIRRIARVLSP